MTHGGFHFSFSCLVLSLHSNYISFFSEYTRLAGGMGSERGDPVVYFKFYVLFIFLTYTSFSFLSSPGKCQGRGRAWKREENYEEDEEEAEEKDEPLEVPRRKSK